MNEWHYEMTRRGKLDNVANQNCPPGDIEFQIRGPSRDIRAVKPLVIRDGLIYMLLADPANFVPP